MTLFKLAICAVQKFNLMGPLVNGFVELLREEIIIFIKNQIGRYATCFAL